MRLELTLEQYNLIQNEVIRLEDSLKTKEFGGWDSINIEDQIVILKRILENEHINLNDLY
jgi:hypothetical protein